MANTTLSIDPYTIAWDGSHNWTVHKTVKATSGKSKGEATEKFIGYYGTLYAATTAVINDGVKKLGATDAGAIRISLVEASRHILAALEAYRPVLEEVPAEALV